MMVNENVAAELCGDDYLYTKETEEMFKKRGWNYDIFYDAVLEGSVIRRIAYPG